MATISSRWAVLFVSLHLAAQDRLIKCDLAVINPGGEPVTDLRIDELQLSEDGKPARIDFFHFLGTRQPASAPAERGDLSNRPCGANRHATIILLDLLSERQLTWEAAAQEVVKSVERQESGEDLYLYILNNKGQIEPIHALPQNVKEAAQAQGDWSKQVRNLVDTASRRLQGFRPVDDRDIGYRAQVTYQALLQFATRLTAIPGHKNLVWITHGVPLTYKGWYGPPIDLTPQVRDFSEALLRTKIAVYTVAQSGSGVGGYVGSSSAEALRMISDLTGGRAYPSNNGDAAITEARADARGLYEIGFYPRRSAHADKFHKLRLTCARKGVRVQAKQGYSLSNPTYSLDARQQLAFEAAGAGLFDDSTIEISSTATPAGGHSSKVSFEIRVNAADLLLPDQGSGQLAMVMIVYNADGSAQMFEEDPIEVRKSQEHIAIRRELSLGPGIQIVRIVAFDRGSESTGSLTIPITRPALSR